MGILIKASSVPYEAVRFTQNARLVPSDQVTVERQKALSRYRACQSRYHGGGIDLDYISQIHRAFSKSPTANFEQLNQGNRFSAASLLAESGTASGQPAAASYPDPLPGMEAFPAGAGTNTANAGQGDFAGFPSGSESSASYAVQRGAFEMRVARGDVSYVPALAMTIVTQYPDVHFEYIGGFNYVPPQDEQNGSSINLQI